MEDGVSGEWLFVSLLAKRFVPPAPTEPFDSAVAAALLMLFRFCCEWPDEWLFVFELPEHGLPSLTNTGTATRRGELAD